MRLSGVKLVMTNNQQEFTFIEKCKFSNHASIGYIENNPALLGHTSNYTAKFTNLKYYSPYITIFVAVTAVNELKYGQIETWRSKDIYIIKLIQMGGSTCLEQHLQPIFTMQVSPSNFKYLENLYRTVGNTIDASGEEKQESFVNAWP